MSKGFWGLIWGICLAAPCFADDRFEPFITGVLRESRHHYDRWARSLLRTGPRGLPALRQHGTPFEPEKRGWSGWFFTRAPKSTPLEPLTQRHLTAVQAIAGGVRLELGLDETVRFNHYEWTEANFLAFESELLARIDQAQADFFVQVDGFHQDRKPPTPYENETLTYQYLDIWVMAALLRVESDRYLSVYPIRATHLERLIERQEEGLGLVADCRTAIVVMADPRYHW